MNAINICAHLVCFAARSCLNCWQGQVQNSSRRYSPPSINLVQAINMGSVRCSWQGGTLKFHLWALCIFLFTLIFPTAVLGGQSPESVTEAPAYSSARPCAQGCVYNGCCTIDIGEAMGCNTNTYCFCRQDLRATGSVFLSKCVNSRCSTNALDMSWAFLAWAQYCSFGDAPSTQPAGTCKLRF